DRAAALAPRDVQAEIGERERDWEAAQDRAQTARAAMDAETAAEAEARAEYAAQDLARLAIADAARREWAEAHAGEAEAARGAEAEGRQHVPPEPEPEPEPQPEPVSDAEFWAQLDQIVRDSQRGPEPEAAAGDAAMYAEVHEDLAAIGEGIRELSDLMDAEDA